MRKPVAVAALAAAGYAVVSYLTFRVPATLADGEACGFVVGDFAADGTLAHAPLDAWWLSFTRQQEFFSALSVGLAIGFIVYALQVSRRVGSTRAAGAAAGGGLLALSALCVSCLAPVLSAVGLGLAGTLLAGFPKWLIALNTALLTGWGAMVLSRRSQQACPLPASRPSNTPVQGPQA